MLLSLLIMFVILCFVPLLSPFVTHFHSLHFVSHPHSHSLFLLSLFLLFFLSFNFY
uniref:Hypothetical secreted peptide n=1 Tax=Glossina morsitans morsitans TaxID=37546 RepID=D3TSP6_GLOMM